MQASFPSEPEAVTLAALSTALAMPANEGQVFPSTPHFRKIARHRLKDVVILAPLDPDCGVKLNLLELRPGESIQHVAREFVSILERLVIDKSGDAVREWMGPMFNLHISMNLLLILSNPEEPGTLLDLEEVFSRKDAWKRWEPFKNCDPRLKNWVENVLPGFDYVKDRPDSAPFGQYIYSKLEDFTGDPRLRRILSSQRSTIDLQEIMDQGRILLVNLSRGLFGAQNSTFLGLLVISMLGRAAMARAAIPVGRRRRLHLYVDEFQNLATESFTGLLSEGRKFGISLVLANQFLSQIPHGGVVKALLANLATLVCFRLGPEDARLLEPFFAPIFSLAGLTNLPRFLACALLRVRGEPVKPFALKTVCPTGSRIPASEAAFAPHPAAGLESPVRPPGAQTSRLPLRRSSATSTTSRRRSGGRNPSGPPWSRKRAGCRLPSTGFPSKAVRNASGGSSRCWADAQR